MQTDGFEGWAIVEIMGHRQVAGFVREVSLFGVKQARIDVPDLPAEPAGPDGWLSARPAMPAFTQFYGGSAIFCTTPVTEEIARAAAQRFRHRPPAEADIRASALQIEGTVSEEETFELDEG